MSEQLNLTLTAESAAAPTESSPSPRRPAQQSRRTAETITRADETLALAATDAEFSALLANFGYDAQGLAHGRALQTAAQQAYLARQQAIAAKQRADAAALAAYMQARRAFADYRRVARALYKTPSERSALSLKGYLPQDLHEMVQLARTAYQAALASPETAALLARYGYPAEKLQAALEGLDAVIAANNAQAAARTSAAYATQQRRATLSALQTWLTQFRAVTRVATRERPDLAARLPA